MKRITSLLVGLVLMGFSAFGQDVQISGKVTNADDGAILPGVSVVVKGTTTGITTNIDGKYSLSVPSDATLVFSFIGMKTQEVVVGNQTAINISMEFESTGLEEVVVTALGITKEKKSLGYSVAEVGGGDLQNKPELDIASSLNGKVAGVNIVKSAGIVGSGSSINIRGMSSINGDNQPLFVVDGVPIDAGTNQVGGFSTGGGSSSMFGNRFLDIDPNNIESVSVLKGLTASALYGEQGRNGVIIITTKTGSGKKGEGFKVDVSQSFYMNRVAQLPDYQNTYGQGGDNATNVGYAGNWGNAFSDGLTVSHHYDQSRLWDIFPEYKGKTVDYKAYPDNVKDFFRDGYGKNTFLNVSNGTEDGNISFSAGYFDEDGFIPKNNVKKFNASIGANYKVGKFSLGGSANFSKTETTSPPFSASNAANAVTILERLLFIPRNLDLTNLPYQEPLTGKSVYYRTDQENPYWLLDNAGYESITNRIFGNVRAAYDFTDYLTLNYQVGLDTYTEEQIYHINKGGVSSDAATDGYLRTTSNTNTIKNHQVMLNLMNISLADKLKLNGQLGTQVRIDEYSRTGIASTKQIVFGFLQHDNFESSSGVDPVTDASLDYISREDQLGVFASVSLDYAGYAFLNISGRNDWTSTVEQENRSIFYPSVSTSFLPTDAFPGLKSDMVNYMKIRLGVASSAGFPSPYNTRNKYSLTPKSPNKDGAVPSISQSNILGNPDLKPELHKEYEAGLEGRFINNRIQLEITGYYRISKDQIVDKSLDPASGYSSTSVNIGRVDNKGVEINLGFTPIRTNGFKWQMNNIFSLNRSLVRDIGDDKISYAGYSNLGNFAIDGEALGVIMGSFAAKDKNGNYLINPNDGKIIGNDKIGMDNEIIGDPNPDYKITSINTLSFKGLSVSGQVDFTKGGDFYSSTITSMLRRGVTKDTEDREGTYVIPGVYANPETGEVYTDAEGNPIQNTIQLGLNDVYFLNYVDPDGQDIYDATVIRLREISIGYFLPKKILDKTPISKLQLLISGQNLWYYAPNVPKYTNFDPETLSTGVGNGMGLEFGSAPSGKKFAFTIKATF